MRRLLCRVSRSVHRCKSSLTACARGISTGKGRVVSAIQPTGVVHLGNYLGAVQNWVKTQSECDEVFYSVADLHAMTSPKRIDDLRAETRATISMLLACGLDPNKCTLFVQSSVSEHCELMWALSCVSSFNRLRTMTQFKTKSSAADAASLGLFSYPVLMTADILLYKATAVPVGDDQTQHLEMARNIAGAFNQFHDKEVFPLPEAVISGEAPRVMSLRDGTSKMSKSALSDMSRITLTDSPDLIRKKIAKAKTDTEGLVTYDPKLRPEVSNLIRIGAAAKGEALSVFASECEGLNMGGLKAVVADAVVGLVQPISEEYARIQSDPSFVDNVITTGAEKAQTVARVTMEEVRQVTGLQPVG